MKPPALARPTPNRRNGLPPQVADLVASRLQQRGQGYVRLHTFHVFARCGTYYRTGPLVGLTHPTCVRRRIEALQAELGLTLVCSDRTGVMLTPHGEALVDLIAPEFDD